MKKLFIGFVLLACTACAGLQDSASPSYNQRAREALAVAQGVYLISKDVYAELRSVGEVDDEQHARIVRADSKLRAAYVIAQDAVASQAPATIKSALQVVCAMSDVVIDELTAIVDAQTMRNARLALIVVRRLALL